jgi:uncharacterized protein
MMSRFTTRCAMLAFIGLAALGFATPAGAETPAPAPSPAALLIAKQIVEMEGVASTFEPVVREEVERVRLAFIQTNFMWTKDINDAAGTVYRSYGSRGTEFVNGIARIYASHFTEAELNGLLTFYQSPLGRKMLAEEPKALEEVRNYAKKWGEGIAPDVMAKMRAELKKRGHDL